MPRLALLFQLLLIVCVSGVVPSSQTVDGDAALHRHAGTALARPVVGLRHGVARAVLGRGHVRVSPKAAPGQISPGLPAAHVAIPPPTGFGSSPSRFSPMRSSAPHGATQLRGPPSVI